MSTDVSEPLTAARLWVKPSSRSRSDAAALMTENSRDVMRKRNFIFL